MPDIPKIDIRPDHWEIVRDILKKHIPEYEVWAFGSRAKWTAKKYSDLDLAVITDKPLSLEVNASLSDDFSESDLPWKVDVVDWATTQDNFKTIIEKDKVIVQKGIGAVSTTSVNTDSLESMCELIADCPHSTPEWTTEGKIVLRNQNIKGGVLDLRSPSYTNKIDFLKRVKRATPMEGDIVFTREAPMGEVCMIPHGLICCLGQRQVLLRPKKDISGKYLFWALQSPFVQQQIAWNEGTGSTVSNVRIPVLKALNIPRHHNSEHSIAKILSSLADKIDLNHQTNQTLEKIAQTIFKSWFVDFEPTRAKIAAKEEWETQNPHAPANDPAKIAFIERAAICTISGKAEAELDQLDEEAIAKLKVTAALFPDALVDSELREIPEGWEIKTINNYLGSVSKTYPLKTVSEVIFLNTGDIQDGKFLHANKSLASTLPGQAKKSIQKNDILYSEIRPENRRFAFVYFDTPEYVVSTKLMVLRATKDIPSIFLYFILTQQSTIDHLQMLAESRSGTFPQITFDALSKIEFIGPANGLLIFRFVETVLIPYFNFKQSIDKQSDYLSELRDAILPKLLSGEIDLSENLL